MVTWKCDWATVSKTKEVLGMNKMNTLIRRYLSFHFWEGAVLFDASKVQLKYREYFVLLPCSCIINKWILMIFFVLTYYYTWYYSIDIFLLAWFDRVREKDTQKKVCWRPLKIGSCQSIIQTQFAFSEARQEKVRGRAILFMLLTI